MKTLSEDQADNLLLYICNELRAIDGGEELPTDRRACAEKLRALATHLETGGVCPSANAILANVCKRPIQR